MMASDASAKRSGCSHGDRK